MMEVDHFNEFADGYDVDVNVLEGSDNSIIRTEKVNMVVCVDF